MSNHNPLPSAEATVLAQAATKRVAREAAAEIAAEADALAKAAEGLRVALAQILETKEAKTRLAYLRRGIGIATPDAVWLHADAALAAFDKATGEQP